MANVNIAAIIVPIVVFLAIAGGLFVAYNQGYLDPIVEKIGYALRRHSIPARLHRSHGVANAVLIGS
jgi:hypothetical protein